MLVVAVGAPAHRTETIERLHPGVGDTEMPRHHHDREEERRRLRRDLHDGLGPQLAAIAMTLETARHALARRPDLEVVYESDRARLASTVSGLLRSGDVCISMGCGDIETLPSEIVAVRGR